MINEYFLFNSKRLVKKMATQSTKLPRLPVLLYMLFIITLSFVLISQTFTWELHLDKSQWLWIITLSVGIVILCKWHIPLMNQTNDDYSMDSSLYLACIFLLGLEQTLIILVIASISYSFFIKRKILIHITNFSFYALGIIFSYYTFILLGGHIGQINVINIYSYIIALFVFMAVNITLVSIFYSLVSKQTISSVLRVTVSFFIPSYFINLLLSICICILIDGLHFLGLFLFLTIAVILSKVFKRHYENYQELNDKKQELEQIFNQVEVAIFTKYLNENNIIISKAVEKIFGITQEEFNQEKWMSMIHPSDQSKIQMLYKKNITQKIEFGYRIIHPSGEIRYLNEVINPVLNEKGESIKVNGVIFDITEKKVTEHRIKEMEKDIQHSERIKLVGELAASVAHEIRNPLTTVRGFLQLFYKDNTISKESKFFINLSLEELDRANNIISDYLSLGKSDDKDMEEINVLKEIQNIIDSIHSFSILHQVKIVLDFKSPDTYLEINRDNLRQVMLNILKNGVEASASRGNGTVSVKVYEKKYITYIEVKDNGIGMEPDEIARLGLPFYSTKEKGTGLGMMVCYKIIDSMKGKIKVTSEKGLGTTFTIVLPKEHLRKK